MASRKSHESKLTPDSDAASFGQLSSTIKNKQPSEVFCKEKVFLEISQNSQENTCTRASFLIKLQAASNFIKKDWNRCFPANLANFLRVPFLQNTSRRLLQFLFTLTCNWIIWPRYSQRSRVNNNKKVLKFLECLSELNRTVFSRRLVTIASCMGGGSCWEGSQCFVFRWEILRW